MEDIFIEKLNFTYLVLRLRSPLRAAEINKMEENLNFEKKYWNSKITSESAVPMKNNIRIFRFIFYFFFSIFIFVRKHFFWSEFEFIKPFWITKCLVYFEFFAIFHFFFISKILFSFYWRRPSFKKKCFFVLKYFIRLPTIIFQRYY